MKNILTVEKILVRRNSNFRLEVEGVRVKAGSILCVAGPNGSGKTTFLECLVGLLTDPDITVKVNYHTLSNNLYKIKALIGYIPDDEEWFIKELCAKEYFDLLTYVYTEAGLPLTKLQYRVKQLANDLQFTDFTQPLDLLSHGNKKKVQIIAGLMHEPKILVVDELRNGLDPLSIIAAEEIVRAEAARGACVVAATHDLWWAERISTEIMLLVDGKVAKHDKTMSLLSSYGSLENVFVRYVLRKSTSHATV